MLRSRRSHASLLGVIASLTITTDTVLSLLASVSLLSSRITFVALSIAASVCSIFGLGCVVLLSAQYAWKRDGLVDQSHTARRTLVFGCIFILILSRAISLSSIVTIKRRMGESKTATSGAVISDWNAYFIAHITVWVASCFTTVALLTTPRWYQPAKSRLLAIPYSEPGDTDEADVQDTIRQTTLKYHVMETVGPSSPSFSATSSTLVDRSSSQSTIDWRESFKHSVRPSSSRSKLISRPSFSRESGRSIYSEETNASQSDGFESWDTSTVSLPTIAAPALLAAPRRGTALEPIPGSRPSSPARPLDGPFPLSDETDENPLSPPPKLLHDISRPPSPAVSESHIHPLFRSESPIPPPEVTPGTSVIASPLANKMISYPAGSYNRMRSSSQLSSRVSSPVPYQNPFSTSRTGTPVPPRSSRSPSPSSRPITPPIPEFVLRESLRSSTSSSMLRAKMGTPPDTSR